MNTIIRTLLKSGKDMLSNAQPVLVPYIIGTQQRERAERSISRLVTATYVSGLIALTIRGTETLANSRKMISENQSRTSHVFKSSHVIIPMVVALVQNYLGSVAYKKISNKDASNVRLIWLGGAVLAAVQVVYGLIGYRRQYQLAGIWQS